MTYDRLIVERRLRERADVVLAEPHNFSKEQVRWARLFVASAQPLDMFGEWALLDASFPALFSEAGWHEYFADRSSRMIEDLSLAELPDVIRARVQRLHRRFAAFAGSYRAPERDTRERIVRTTRPLVIGIDIRPLSIPSTRNRGIGRYLIGTLTELIRQNVSHSLVLLCDRQAVADDELIKMFFSDRVTFREFGPGCDRDLDVFLLTDPSPMLTGRRTAELPVHNAPWMSIVYDFIPLEFPDLYLRCNETMLDEYLDNIDTLAERARAVFPISKYVGCQCSALLGIAEECIVPIMGGVDADVFASPGVPEAPLDRPYFLYVGGADARKNIPGLIRAFDIARPSLPANSALVLAGEMNDEKTCGLLAQLKCEYLRGDVIGLGGVDDARLRALYAHATATVFVSLSEGLGLPALEAMAAGCPVVASNGSALAETIGSCGLLVDPLSPREIADALITIANDQQLRSRFITLGREHAKSWTWSSVATALLTGIERHAGVQRAPSARSRRMRVAMLNRPNVWTAPGGDGRIMMQMQEAVKQNGIDVYFPQTVSECESADIIHFVNLTLPDPLSKAAAIAEAQRVPFVVTSLYEDWTQYLEPSHLTYALAKQYVGGRLSLEDLSKLVLRQPATGRVPQIKVDGVLTRTAALYACGESEARRLREDFPAIADRVRVVPFAVTAPAEVDDSIIQSLYRTLGFDQFALCIGRLETRKNQLMLLAALQDMDIPIVFATGGFTPQPEYRATVQRWKRKAPIRYVDRISWVSMSTLIRAASVHALPSFYELPGLVHLECAAAGIPIVAGSWGALTDYLPIGAFHPCEPIDIDSIRAAVESALAAPPIARATDLAMSYSLERLGESLAREYELVSSTALSPKKSLSAHKPQGKIAAVTGGLHVAAQ